MYTKLPNLSCVSTIGGHTKQSSNCDTVYKKYTVYIQFILITHTPCSADRDLAQILAYYLTYQIKVLTLFKDSRVQPLRSSSI